MSTHIQWTDETWNPVTGCTKVSPGCAHCYAEGVAERFWGAQYPPVEVDAYSPDNCCPITEMRARQFTDVQTHTDRLDQPLRWKKPRRVFVNSMSDLFHEAVPDAFIDRVFGVMACSGRHTFQILTKRAERMQAYCHSRASGEGKECLNDQIQQAMDMCEDVGVSPYAHEGWAPYKWPLPNVDLGVSVENQHFADERIPQLLQTPAAVRFISAEPLFEDVRLVPYLGYGVDLVTRQQNTTKPLDWVIVGGESGPKARTFDLAWARSIRDQCGAAGVPFFFKQAGAEVIESLWPRQERQFNNFGRVHSVNYHDRKGGDMAEWPTDLRVREFPIRP